VEDLPFQKLIDTKADDAIPMLRLYLVDFEFHFHLCFPLTKTLPIA